MNKINYDKIVYYEVVGKENYIVRLETAKCPLFIWHFIKRLALFLDKLVDLTGRLLRKLTKEEINIDNSFQLPDDFFNLYGSHKKETKK